MIYVEKITISPRTKVLNVGDKYRGASAVVCPSNATCKSIRWYSADSSKATVTGTTGYIRAIAPGKVKIYAEATDGSGVRNYIGIVVKQPVTDISLDCSNATINIGESKTVTATVSPSNASNKNISWTSCDESVATVNSNGVVTGKSAGTTTIVASAQDGSGVIAYITIEVTEPESIKELRIKSSSSVNVAIKENPSNGSETVGYIANNTIVNLIDAEPQNTKWYKIYWKDSNGNPITGWCSGEYLEEKKIIYVVTYEDGIIGRDNPSNNYKQIASFFPGSWIIPIDNRLYGENNNYYRIKWLDTGITPCKYIDCYVTNDETCYTIDRQWMPLIANNVSYMGIEMIKNLEGFSESAIPDRGKYSIGYGHNIQDGGTTVTINGENYSIITKSLANQLLTEDLNSLFVPAFNSFLQNNNIVLNQNQYDACIIDCYQKGKNIWNNQQSDISIFIKDKTNFDNWQEVLDAFLDGVQVGDANYIRRYREAGLFLYWYYWKEIPTRGQST